MNSQIENSLVKIKRKLNKTPLIIHKSIWLSRQLKHSQSVLHWLEKANHFGLNLNLPASHGLNCIDCCGEGAYKFLFDKQAYEMANDFWVCFKREI